MSEIFNQVTDQLVHDLEKIGLYVQGLSMGGIPNSEDIAEKIMNGEITEEDAIKNGLADFHILISTRIGDVAWSDRVLNPESFTERKEFEMIVPESKEIDLDEIRRELEEWDAEDRD